MPMMEEDAGTAVDADGAAEHHPLGEQGGGEGGIEGGEGGGEATLPPDGDLLGEGNPAAGVAPLPDYGPPAQPEAQPEAAARGGEDSSLPKGTESPQGTAVTGQMEEHPAGKGAPATEGEEDGSFKGGDAPHDAAVTGQTTGVPEVVTGAGGDEDGSLRGAKALDLPPAITSSMKALPPDMNIMETTSIMIRPDPEMQEKGYAEHHVSSPLEAKGSNEEEPREDDHHEDVFEYDVYVSHEHGKRSDDFEKLLDIIADLRERKVRVYTALDSENGDDEEWMRAMCKSACVLVAVSQSYMDKVCISIAILCLPVENQSEAHGCKKCCARATPS